MSSRGHVIGPGPTSRHLVVANQGHSIYICIGKHLCWAHANQPLAASILASYDQAPRLIAASSTRSHVVAVVPSATAHDVLAVFDTSSNVLNKTRSALPAPIISMTIGEDLIIYTTKTRVAVCRWPSINSIAIIDATATSAVSVPGSKFILAGHSHYLGEMHVVGTGLVQQIIADRYDDDFLDLIAFRHMNLNLVASQTSITIISGDKVLERRTLSSICVRRDSELITMLTKTGKECFVITTTACILRRFTIAFDGLRGTVNLIHVGDIQAGSEIIDVVALNLNELLCIRRGRTPAMIDLASSEIACDQPQTACAILGLTPIGQKRGFLTVSADGLIRLWDYRTRNCCFQVENDAEEHRPISVVASPNGFQLCTVVRGSVLLYYILHDGIQLYRTWNCVGVSRARYSHSVGLDLSLTIS